MDATKLAHVTALLMDKIEADYGSDAVITDSIVLAEIDFPDPETGERVNVIEWWCSSDRSSVREGLIAVAAKAQPIGEEHDES
jgi:hypothetical protein